MKRYLGHQALALLARLLHPPPQCACTLPVISARNGCASSTPRCPLQTRGQAPPSSILLYFAQELRALLDEFQVALDAINPNTMTKTSAQDMVAMNEVVTALTADPASMTLHITTVAEENASVKPLWLPSTSQPRLVP
jgi:hypothetical protein